MNRFTFALCLAVAAGAVAAIPDPVTGCAAAPHHGERVETSDESALIVWDEKTKTEYFVRRASFRSTGYDFGFLVPTPNKPDLDVANDTMFAELAAITAPKVEYREVVKAVDKEFPLGCVFASKSASDAAGLAESQPAAKAGGVDVLEQKRVGDYDATVLVFRRGDGDTPERGAQAMAEWLAKHGYESPPAIEKWLKKYVTDGWCITAFKIATPEPKKDGANAPGTRRDVRAKPIRMSFKADRPFYPYREPETDPATQPANEARSLRVFVAASARYAGKLGDGAKLWPGQTMWAGPVDEGRWTSVFGHAKLMEDGKPALALSKEATGYWLTEFEDRSSPRPGTDEVYFEPAADASPVARPPRIITTTRTVVVTPWWHAAVYFGVPAAMLLCGLLLWRLLPRRPEV